MATKQTLQAILKELNHNWEYIHDEQMDMCITCIMESNHIFTTGAGRSGLAMQAFTNRLLYLRLSGQYGRRNF